LPSDFALRVLLGKRDLQKKTATMLTGRTVIIAAIVLAALSLLGSMISMLQPPDQDGLGIDTYGTRALGYKAVYDTLRELGVDERREFGPPSEKANKNTTLVLWGPQSDLIDVEPTYVRRLRQWIRSGGRLVIAPDPNREASGGIRNAQLRNMAATPVDVLAEIGLVDLETEVVAANPDDAAAAKVAAERERARQDDYVKSKFDEYLFPQLFPTTTVSVRAKGDWKRLGPAVSSLRVPAELRVLTLGLTKPDGTLVLERKGAAAQGKSEGGVVAAQFKLGSGEVIVVGDPAIFDNHLLAEADNSVLAAHLIGGVDQPVVWDEFYHGLTIRANPMFLLTRGMYGLIAALTVALVGVWVWRQAIFLGPPLTDAPVSRRAIGEYVEAMAHFLRRSSGSLRYMLLELRHGVLWSMRRKYSSQREATSLEGVAAAVERRDPRAARQLVEAVRTTDQVLSRGSLVRERELLQVAKDLLDCH
jgi:hypothetical protein